MKFCRISPIQQESFYVLSDKEENLSIIAHSPICFSPVNYEVEEVDAGDIPANSKIVVIDKHTKRISRVNLNTAIKISNGSTDYTMNDISAALDGLRMAMLRNGLHSPAYIQLESFDQAYKLARGFEQLPCLPADFSITEKMDPGEAGEFWIMGVSFHWPAAESA